MAGLLDILKSQWQQGEPYRNALGGLIQGDTQPVRSLLGTDQPWPTAEQAQAGTRDMSNAWNNPDVQAALGFAPLGITAWHGSPHKFDKFDMSKIGTGEGAQAYGHGLYFADSPDVARSYLKANGSGNDLTVTLGGKDIAWGNQLTDDQLKAISLLEWGMKDAGQFPHNASYYAKKRTDNPNIQKIIDEWKDAKIGYKD